MFAVIYQSFVKQGYEEAYQVFWKVVAKYFIENRGALGSCLHRVSDGSWLAYSRWPDKATRDASWPGEGAPLKDLPIQVQKAIMGIKDCLDPERKFPEVCLDVAVDLFT